MTAAYEYGVREIWVTNIGDIGTQEFGLSYFLDLAYDIDVWGGQDAAITTQYTAQWVRRNFGAAFAPADLPRIEGIITDYTRLLARRKHEKMGENTYHPTHYGEAEEVLQISEHILTECEALKTACPQEDPERFYLADLLPGVRHGQFDEDVDPDRAQPSVRQTEPRCRQPAGR